MKPCITSANSLILCLVYTLSACGGGVSGSMAEQPVASVVTQSVAKTTSANTAVITNEASAAQAEVVSATQAVVAATQANLTHNCAGGGTAVYQVTGSAGSPLAQLTNGQLDAGENYTLAFNACKGVFGSVAINGALSLSVTSASAGNIAVNTSTTGLVVTRPRGNETLNGSSSLQISPITQGSTTTTTTRWTTPNYTLNTAYNARSSSFTLSNVDITNSVTTTNGMVTGSTHSGTSTLSANLPNGAFSVTTATQGSVSYDASGKPTAGSWTITLPNNRILLSVVTGKASLGVDYGADGTVDATYTFTVDELELEAG